MAAEPSWGPSIGNRPLKWTEIGPTNDPWVISDEFETFGDNHFWRRQTRTKIFVQNIIHFIKIQNIHFFKIQNIPSNKIFICLKSRIFIQTKYSFFSKRAVSPRAIWQLVNVSNIQFWDLWKGTVACFWHCPVELECAQTILASVLTPTKTRYCPFEF